MADNGMSRPLEIDKLNIAYKERITYKYNRDIINRAIFNKIRRANAIGWGTRIYKEKEPYIYDENVAKLHGNVMLSGYWQNERYFAEYKDELAQLFTPKETGEKAKAVRSEIKSYDNSVAVHIRRGDYLDVKAYIGPDYFERAMKIMEEKLGEVNYCFFSDDIAWVRDYFGEKSNHHFISGQEGMRDIDEFFCMASCSHNITANSTFSWWASYLNANKDKIVIAPKVVGWGGDIYPKEWITLESHLAGEN
jgi:hypothetical protein